MKQLIGTVCVFMLIPGCVTDQIGDVLIQVNTILDLLKLILPALQGA